MTTHHATMRHQGSLLIITNLGSIAHLPQHGKWTEKMWFHVHIYCIHCHLKINCKCALKIIEPFIKRLMPLAASSSSFTLHFTPHQPPTNQTNVTLNQIVRQVSSRGSIKHFDLWWRGGWIERSRQSSAKLSISFAHCNSLRAQQMIRTITHDEAWEYSAFRL